MDSQRGIQRGSAEGAGTQTLSDRVFGVVETAIVTGEIPLGAKLGESALAKRCGVSRGPLREALRRLEGRHLVERPPHAGVRVVSLPRDDAVQIYLVREALEGMACRLAALAMAERDIDELERLLDQHSLSAALRCDPGHVEPRDQFLPRQQFLPSRRAESEQRQGVNQGSGRIPGIPETLDGMRLIDPFPAVRRRRFDPREVRQQSRAAATEGGAHYHVPFHVAVLPIVADNVGDA